jgi:hypothetical protein
MRNSCALVLLLALSAASCEGFRLQHKQTQQVLPRQEAAEEDVQHQESTRQTHDLADDEDDVLLSQEEVHEFTEDEVKEAGEEQSGEHDPEEPYLANEETDEGEEEEPGEHDTEEASLAQEEVVEDQDEEGEEDEPEESETDEFTHMTTVMLQTDANSSSRVAAIPVKLQDCGDSKTLGRSKRLTPKTLKKGINNKMTSTGTLKRTVPGGKFDLTVKMTGFPYSSLGSWKNKDICKDHKFDLYSGPIYGGTITWKGLKCPIKKGKITTISYMKMAKSIPAGMISSKTSIRAKYKGTKLLCSNIVSGR